MGPDYSDNKIKIDHDDNSSSANLVFLLLFLFIPLFFYLFMLSLFKQTIDEQKETNRNKYTQAYDLNISLHALF